MKEKLVKGVAWLGAAKVVVNLLALCSTLIMARLLTPGDFGLVALATAMLTIIQSVTSLSLSSALIHHKAPTDRHYHTAWTLNFVRAIFIGLLFCAAGPMMASAYSESRLVNIMLVIGVSVTLTGLNNPKTVALTRTLVFWQEFVMTVSQKLAGFVVGVGMAFIYKSYWALIGGMLASQFIGIVVSYLVIPFRPGFSLAYARELWSFSIWLTLGKIVNTLNWRLDQLLIGRHIGTTALGLYSVGDNLAGLPTAEAIGPLEATLFPGFKHVADDGVRLKQAYRSAQSLISAIALPVGVGVALIAQPLVLLAMGTKWLLVADVMQVLSCVFALQTLSSPVVPLAMAKGETKLLFNRDLLIFVVRVPIIVLAMYLGGLQGVIYARAITGTLGMYINMHLVRRLIGTEIIEQLSSNVRSLLSIIVMSVGVLSIEYYWGRDGTPILLGIKIAVFVLSGAILYSISHMGLWHLANKPKGPETEIVGMATKLFSKINQRKFGT
jgi:lipopolysaccharide exporter